MTITTTHVQFQAHGLELSAILNLPSYTGKQKYPAIICVHPGSSCKEQTAGKYAQKLAESGYATIVFDASYQGESQGNPRFAEYPAARVEDIRCAVDYLTTQNDIDENRIGVLGICAGGGYAVNAAMTERRIKAIGTVVGINIGRGYRSEGDPIQMLEIVAQQRTAEARGADPLVVEWIPNSHAKREAAGMTDIDLIGAVDYYRTPRGQHPHSPNQLRYTSVGTVIGFDAFHLAEVLLTIPLQIIVGGVQGAYGSYLDGFELYEKAASTHKDLFVIEGANHYDLYDQPEPVDKAVEQLTTFYTKFL